MAQICDSVAEFTDYFHSSPFPRRNRPFLAQDTADGGSQLPLRAQEAARQASGARADQGDHAAGEPDGHLPGGVHGGGGAAKTRGHLQVGSGIPVLCQSGCGRLSG